jgi:hypothetical protein
MKLAFVRCCPFATVLVALLLKPIAPASAQQLTPSVLATLQMPSQFTVRYEVDRIDVSNKLVQDGRAGSLRLHDQELVRQGELSQSAADGNYRNALKQFERTAPTTSCEITVSDADGKILYVKQEASARRSVLYNGKFTIAVDYGKNDSLRDSDQVAVSSGLNMAPMEDFPMPAVGTPEIPFIADARSVAGKTVTIIGKSPQIRQGEGASVALSPSTVTCTVEKGALKVSAMSIADPSSGHEWNRWDITQSTWLLGRWIPSQMSCTEYNNYLQDGSLAWAPDVLYRFTLVGASADAAPASSFSDEGLLRSHALIVDDGVLSGEPIAFDFRVGGMSLQDQAHQALWARKARAAATSGQSGATARAPEALFVVAAILVVIAGWFLWTRRSTEPDV